MTRQEDFGAWFRRRFPDAEITPTAFAKRVGLSHATVLNYTQGKTAPRKSEVGVMAEKLGVSFDEVWRAAGYDRARPGSATPQESPALALFERGELPDEAWAELEDFAAYIRFKYRDKLKERSSRVGEDGQP